MGTSVIISGYFDPLHVGHLKYIENARKHGDYLIVIVNNDLQAEIKKGKAFMPLYERMEIVENIKGVDEVWRSIDEGRGVQQTLGTIRNFHRPRKKMIFFNEGDVFKCKEEGICKELGIKVVYGKAQKIQSSSWLTK